MSEYRPELPPDMPAGIAALPVFRGYPVPWFVAWVEPEGENMGTPVPPGNGDPDFRILAPGAIGDALKYNLCWICGRHMPIGSTSAFVVGPMCAVNRNSAEPPGHEARPFSWHTRQVANGILFNIGEPLRVKFYAQGRQATRAEIMESIEGGLPTLVEMANRQPGAAAILEEKLAEALALLPAA